jgi:hypothetical protein
MKTEDGSNGRDVDKYFKIYFRRLLFWAKFCYESYFCGNKLSLESVSLRHFAAES